MTETMNNFQNKEGSALLVDGDNVSPKYAGRLITESGGTKGLRIRRVYGNATKLPGWDNAPGYHLVHSGDGKNSSDMLLAVDAMDLFLRQNIQSFILVSSDRDFSHLATYLRENGAKVLGIGEEKTPEAMRKSCSAFKILETKTESDKKSEADLVSDKVRRFIQTRGPMAAVKIQDLGVHMNRVHNIKISKFPEKNWRKFLTDRADYFICDPRGPEARVRLK